MYLLVLLSMTQSYVLGKVVDEAARLSLEVLLPIMLSRDVFEFLDVGEQTRIKHPIVIWPSGARPPRHIKPSYMYGYGLI